MKVHLSLLLLACLMIGCTPDRSPAPMAAPALVVTVDYHAQPGQGDALYAAMEGLLAEVRKEPHFLGVTVLRDAQDPDRILLYERWADKDYYTGPHGDTPHLDAFKSAAMPLLAGPPAVSLWGGVAEVLQP